MTGTAKTKHDYVSTDYYIGLYRNKVWYIT